MVALMHVGAEHLTSASPCADELVRLLARDATVAFLHVRSLRVGLMRTHRRPPDDNPAAVARQRASRHPLTRVTGGTGWGKTTAIAARARRAAEAGPESFAWLTLEVSDATRITAPGGLPPLRLMEAVTEPIGLVLDEFQVITDPDVIAGVGAFDSGFNGDDVRALAMTYLAHMGGDPGAEGFRGTEAPVAYYLTADVLHSASREVRDLLLRTSVVEVVSHDLADAIVAGGRRGTRLKALACPMALSLTRT